MNNPFDDSLHHVVHTGLDDLMQSVGLDTHQHPDVQPVNFPDTDLHQHNYVELTHQTGFQTEDANFSNHITLDWVSHNHQPLDNYQTDTTAQSDAYHNYATPENPELHNLQHVATYHSDSAESTLSQTVHFYPDGDVFWNGGGKAGHVSGNVFYNAGGEKIAYLGADWKIYDVYDKRIGYIDEHGNAHNLAGTTVASGGTAKWAAAQLIYNVASPA